jgi:hypothetical protein
MASAMIAKIPEAVSRHIARVYTLLTPTHNSDDIGRLGERCLARPQPEHRESASQ